MRVNHSEGTGSMLCAEGRYPLPPHPDPTHAKHGRKPSVLPAAYAPLVLEDLALPSDADPRCVYHATAGVPAATRPFVHVVWCTHAMLEERGGCDPGTAAARFGELSACIRGPSQATSSPSVQPFSGFYRELGWGVLAGAGRGAVNCSDGHASVLPFRRDPATSDRLAPALGSLFGMCAHVAHDVLPKDVLQEHLRPWHACPEDIARAWQYPPLPPGTPPLMSHQVALRGVDESGEAEDVERRCLEAVSDLHVDRGDGLLSFAIYSCECNESQDVRARLRHRDLAVFPFRPGGRGVRIPVLVPGWVCMVFMCTPQCLHGGVCAEPPLEVRTSSGPQLPPLALPPGMSAPVRIIAYPMQMVENLMSHLHDDADGVAYVRRNLARDAFLAPPLRERPVPPPRQLAEPWRAPL